MESLDILAVTLRYPPYTVGGYELLTHDAIEGLRDRGHRVRVLCGAGGDHEETEELLPWLTPSLDAAADLFDLHRDGSPVERLGLHFLSRPNLAATRRAIRARRPDLVLYFNLGLASVAPPLAARLAGVPSLGYVCDPWPENLWLRDMADQPDKAGKRRLLAPLWRILRRAAALPPMICASEFLRRRLLADGWRADEVGVLPTGLSPTMERLASSGERAERGPRLRILCTSMLWSGKGQDVLVRAFASAVREGLDAELVLAGREPSGTAFTEELRGLADEAGVLDRLTFVGMLEPEALSAELFASQVLVLPSIWGEPFGLATIEAMAHGLCTVVSDSGASPELVGDAGVVVPTGDAPALARVLLELGADVDRREALGRAARERALKRFGRAPFLEGLEAAARAAAAGRSALEAVA